MERLFYIIVKLDYCSFSLPGLPDSLNGTTICQHGWCNKLEINIDCYLSFILHIQLISEPCCFYFQNISLMTHFSPSITGYYPSPCLTLYSLCSPLLIDIILFPSSGSLNMQFPLPHSSSYTSPEPPFNPLRCALIKDLTTLSTKISYQFHLDHCDLRLYFYIPIF